MSKALIGVLLFAMPYTDAIEQWRHQREERLKADGGWLTVAGLYWLKEGPNAFGSSDSNAIVLPAGAPASAGEFEFHAGKTRVRLASGVTAMVGGRPVSSAELRADTDKGGPDTLVIGRLSMFVIQRGDRFGIRLKDLDSRFRREFTGLHWFPVRESYRILADWTPYSPVKKLSVPNILGQTEESPCPGIARFTLNGKQASLEPVLEGDQLFFIFRDLTTGKETYPAGRFLYSSLAKDGKVELDFNKAYNPPCAFTPFATCPLPPAGNRMPVRVEAGELTYHHE